VFARHVIERTLVHCKKDLRDFWIFFDQTFLGLELGSLFPARESLVGDIPAGDGNIAKLVLQCTLEDGYETL